jgi:Tol biopolymer transport system component
MRKSSHLGIVVACLALVACGKTHGSGDDTDGGGFDFSAVKVLPADSSLSVPLGGTATQTYQVIGEGSGGETDVTSQCTISVDPAFGQANAAIVTVGPHGGVAAVTALCNGITGGATLTVNVTGSVTLGSNTPANAAQLFASATLGADPASAPTVQYPIDKAVAPLNLPPIEVQWAAGGTTNLFHITMTSSHQAIDIYTSDLQATLSADQWSAVAGTAAGESLAIVVEALDQAAPATKYASTATSLVMSHDTIDTSAIYYWASSKGDIMTQTFGATDAPQVVKDNCSGCHSLSRSGTRIAYSRCVAGNCGPEYIGFLKYSTAGGSGSWNEVVDADNEAIAGSYTTFAPVGNPFPDDSQAVAIVTLTDDSMALYDPDTGSAVASNLQTVSRHSIDGTGAATNRTAMMPDWSADGNHVVFTSTPNNAFVDLDQGSIAVMDYQYTAGQHTFSEPRTVVTGPITLPNGTFENLFFPSYSPDGAYIVFNAARGQWRDLNAGEGRTPGQRLMLTNGSGAVVDLSAMNGGAVDLDVTWPHWAPGATSDYYWVVFSSERDYGHEITQGNTAAGCVENGMLQCKQLWIGAISKAALAAGLTVDPSSPPMWLPGQDPQADNISPYWTKPASIQ